MGIALAQVKVVERKHRHLMIPVSFRLKYHTFSFFTRFKLSQTCSQRAALKSGRLRLQLGTQASVVRVLPNNNEVRTHWQ